jgi:hypothetical protein
LAKKEEACVYNFNARRFAHLALALNKESTFFKGKFALWTTYVHCNRDGKKVGTGSSLLFYLLGSLIRFYAPDS